MFSTSRVVPALFLLGLTAQGAVADSTLGVGAEYSEGDYGTGETSRSWYIPVDWRYTAGAYSASVTIPWLSVDGSTLVAPGGRPISSSGMGGVGGGGGGSGSTATTHSDSGLGDVVLSGSYQLLSESQNRPWVAATAKVKLGTADETKGLGTGETDYTLQLEAAKGMFSGYAGYSVLGDSATVDYNNVAFAGLALSIPLTASHTLGVDYYTEQAALDGMEDPRQAGIALSGDLEGGKGYALYYRVGLSDSSADSVMGVNFTLPL